MCYAKRSKVLAIIQARLTSTRLPGKILEKIGDMSILLHCFQRTQEAMLVDKVVIASPHPIPGFDTFIGEEKDVLDRYYQCAKQYNPEVVVRITSDCPFIDPNIIDQAIEYYFTTDHKYICFAPIDGLDTEVFSFKLLEEAWKEAKDPYDREHVTPYMRRKTKLSIDTEQDLRKARVWYGLHK